LPQALDSGAQAVARGAVSAGEKHSADEQKSRVNITNFMCTESRCLRRRYAAVGGEGHSHQHVRSVTRLFRILLASIYQNVQEMVRLSDNAALARERARFLADFAVTTKEHQRQCALKSKPSLGLVIVLLD
jgi:hypothetical protein